jgi:hypothetical protein
MRLLLLILGIPAIVLLLLPYTSSTSPWAAVSASDGYTVGMPITLLGWPFFLAVPICIAQVRLFLKKSFPRTERAVYRSLAYAALACGLVFLTLGTREEGFTEETFGMYLKFGIPFLVAVSLIVFSRRHGPEKAALVALMAAWLPNAILCGITFWERSLFSGWQIGAYLAAFTIVLYSVEITLLLTRKETVPERNAGTIAK